MRYRIAIIKIINGPIQMYNSKIFMKWKSVKISTSLLCSYPLFAKETLPTNATITNNKAFNKSVGSLYMGHSTMILILLLPSNHTLLS